MPYFDPFANPAAPLTGIFFRFDKLRGMRSLKHFQYLKRPVRNAGAGWVSKALSQMELLRNFPQWPVWI